MVFCECINAKRAGKEDSLHAVLFQDELQAEKQTAVDDVNIKRMRIESRYTKPRLPMPTDDDRITMLAEQVIFSSHTVIFPSPSSRPSAWLLSRSCLRWQSPARSSLS